MEQMVKPNKTLNMYAHILNYNLGCVSWCCLICTNVTRIEVANEKFLPNVCQQFPSNFQPDCIQRQTSKDHEES